MRLRGTVNRREHGVRGNLTENRDVTNHRGATGSLSLDHGQAVTLLAGGGHQGVRLAEQLLVLLVAHAVVHLHVLTDEAFVGELHQALRRHLRQQVQAVIRQGTHRQQQGFYVLVRHERTHVHQVLDGLLFAGGGAFQRGLAGDDATGLRGVGHHEQRLGGQLVLTNQ